MVASMKILSLKIQEKESIHHKLEININRKFYRKLQKQHQCPLKIQISLADKNVKNDNMDINIDKWV